MTIHDIDAHSDDMWCKKINVDRFKKRYVNWLQDEHMLLVMMQNTRIMRYKYQLQWYDDETISQKILMMTQRLLLSLTQVCKIWSCSSALNSDHAHNHIDVSSSLFNIHRALL